MFEVLIQEAKLRNFSPRTIKVYLQYNQQFLQFCRKKPTEVTTQDIRLYENSQKTIDFSQWMNGIFLANFLS